MGARLFFTAAELAAAHIPQTDWPIVDLCTAGGLAKATIERGNGVRAHRLHDRRTGQAWGCWGVEEAGRLGLALTRLRGITEPARNNHAA